MKVRMLFAVFVSSCFAGEPTLKLPGGDIFGATYEFRQGKDLSAEATLRAWINRRAGVEWLKAPAPQTGPRTFHYGAPDIGAMEGLAIPWAGQKTAAGFRPSGGLAYYATPGLFWSPTKTFYWRGGESWGVGLSRTGWQNWTALALGKGLPSVERPAVLSEETLRRFAPIGIKITPSDYAILAEKIGPESVYQDLWGKTYVGGRTQGLLFYKAHPEKGVLTTQKAQPIRPAGPGDTGRIAAAEQMRQAGALGESPYADLPASRAYRLMTGRGLPGEGVIRREALARRRESMKTSAELYQLAKGQAEFVGAMAAGPYALAALFARDATALAAAGRRKEAAQTAAFLHPLTASFALGYRAPENFRSVKEWLAGKAPGYEAASAGTELFFLAMPGIAGSLKNIAGLSRLERIRNLEKAMWTAGDPETRKFLNEQIKKEWMAGKFSVSSIVAEKRVVPTDLSSPPRQGGSGTPTAAGDSAGRLAQEKNALEEIRLSAMSQSAKELHARINESGLVGVRVKHIGSDELLGMTKEARQQALGIPGEPAGRVPLEWAGQGKKISEPPADIRRRWEQRDIAWRRLENLQRKQGREVWPLPKKLKKDLALAERMGDSFASSEIRDKLSRIYELPVKKDEWIPKEPKTEIFTFALNTPRGLIRGVKAEVSPGGVVKTEGVSLSPESVEALRWLKGQKDAGYRNLTDPETFILDGRKSPGPHIYEPPAVPSGGMGRPVAESPVPKEVSEKVNTALSAPRKQELPPAAAAAAAEGTPDRYLTYDNPASRAAAAGEELSFFEKVRQRGPAPNEINQPTPRQLSYARGLMSEYRRKVGNMPWVQLEKMDRKQVSKFISDLEHALGRRAPGEVKMEAGGPKSVGAAQRQRRITVSELIETRERLGPRRPDYQVPYIRLRGKYLAREAGFEPGDKLSVSVNEGRVVLEKKKTRQEEPPANPVEDAAGRATPSYGGRDSVGAMRTRSTESIIRRAAYEAVVKRDPDRARLQRIMKDLERNEEAAKWRGRSQEEGRFGVGFQAQSRRWSQGGQERLRLNTLPEQVIPESIPESAVNKPRPDPAGKMGRLYDAPPELWYQNRATGEGGTVGAAKAGFTEQDALRLNRLKREFQDLWLRHPEWGEPEDPMLRRWLKEAGKRPKSPAKEKSVLPTNEQPLPGDAVRDINRKLAQAQKQAGMSEAALEVQRKMLSQISSARWRDTQTGLYNRNYITDNLPKLLEENNTVLYLDLNDLKRLNDSYGHQAGDALIEEFAKVLSKFVETGKVNAAARPYASGDEFVVFTRARSGEQTRELAQEIRNAVKGLTPVLEKRLGRKIPGGLTVSVGTAGIRRSDIKEGGALSEAYARVVGRAEKAMYRDKRLGKRVKESIEAVPGPTQSQPEPPLPEKPQPAKHTESELRWKKYMEAPDAPGAASAGLPASVFAGSGRLSPDGKTATYRTKEGEIVVNAKTGEIISERTPQPEFEPDFEHNRIRPIGPAIGAPEYEPRQPWSGEGLPEDLRQEAILGLLYGHEKIAVNSTKQLKPGKATVKTEREWRDFLATAAEEDLRFALENSRRSYQHAEIIEALNRRLRQNKAQKAQMPDEATLAQSSALTYAAALGPFIGAGVVGGGIQGIRALAGDEEAKKWFQRPQPPHRPVSYARKRGPPTAGEEAYARRFAPASLDEKGKKEFALAYWAWRRSGLPHEQALEEAGSETDGGLAGKGFRPEEYEVDLGPAPEVISLGVWTPPADIDRMDREDWDNLTAWLKEKGISFEQWAETQ